MFSIWLCFIFGCVLFGCFCVFVYCVCETTGQDVQRGITQRPTDMVYIKVRLLNRDSFRNRRATQYHSVACIDADGMVVTQERDVAPW